MRVPEDIPVVVTELDCNKPSTNKDESDKTTEPPGGRAPKATLEGCPQDGVGIRPPSTSAGLASASCAGGGITFQEVK